jgi:hypothetical protein
MFESSAWAAIRQPGGGAKAARKESGSEGEIHSEGGTEVLTTAEVGVSVGGYAVGRKDVLVAF